jgi:hypothetical protein
MILPSGAVRRALLPLSGSPWKNLRGRAEGNGLFNVGNYPASSPLVPSL